MILKIRIKSLSSCNCSSIVQKLFAIPIAATGNQNYFTDSDWFVRLTQDIWEAFQDWPPHVSFDNFLCNMNYWVIEFSLSKLSYPWNIMLSRTLSFRNGFTILYNTPNNLSFILFFYFILQIEKIQYYLGWFTIWIFLNQMGKAPFMKAMMALTFSKPSCLRCLNPNPLTSLMTVTPAICVFTSLETISR